MEAADQMLAGMLKRFDLVQPGGTGLSPVDGDYQFKVLQCENKMHPQANYPFFNATLEVFWCSNGQHSRGTVLDWSVWMKNPQHMDTYMKDVKKFIFNVLKGSPQNQQIAWEQVTGQTWMYVAGAPNPLKDFYVAASFVTKPQRHDKSKDFMYTSWRPWRGPGYDVMQEIVIPETDAQTHVPSAFGGAPVQQQQQQQPVQVQVPQNSFAAQAQAVVAQSQPQGWGAQQPQQQNNGWGNQQPQQQNNGWGNQGQQQPQQNGFAPPQQQPQQNGGFAPNPGFAPPQQQPPQGWPQQNGGFAPPQQNGGFAPPQQQQPVMPTNNPFGGPPAAAPNAVPGFMPQMPQG